MTNKIFYKNEFLIPFSNIIFLVLHTPMSSNKNIVIIDNLPKPLGIHHNNLLTNHINNFLPLNIFKRGSFYRRKIPLRNHNSLNLSMFLYDNICYYKIHNFTNFILAQFQCSLKHKIVSNQIRRNSNTQQIIYKLIT